MTLKSSLKRSYRGLLRAKNKWQHRGKGVFCPICESEFREFGVFGVQNRVNAECHQCGSLERHRLLWLYIKEHLSILNPSQPIRVLHFAPEEFFYRRLTQLSHIDYTAGDLFPEVYDYPGEVEIITIDATAIPFPDNTFDFILCNHILEHIPDDHQAMQELYRVMKPGGCGIFQVPMDYAREETYEDFSITSPQERLKAFGQEDHVRWYGKDYPKRLERAGFNVLIDDYVQSFSAEEDWRFGLMKEEMIYLGRKG